MTGWYCHGCNKLVELCPCTKEVSAARRSWQSRRATTKGVESPMDDQKRTGSGKGGER